MNIYHKDRRNKGYTLAELLMVVAIIGLLCGITALGVTNYYKHLKQMEMDRTAKELYIAAQNHLTYADTTGVLAEYQSDEKAPIGKLMTKKPVDMDEQEWSEDSYYYLVYQPNQASELEDTILKEILPLGSIDGTVREAGSYIIEYNLKTATIYSVFYTGNAQENYLSERDEIENLLPGDGYRGSPKQRMKYPSASGKKFPLGYYGGSGIILPSVEKIEEPILEILNGDKLTLKISDQAYGENVKNQETSTKAITAISIEVKGQKSQAKKILELKTKKSGMHLKKNSSKNESYQNWYLKTENKQPVYYATLDDITTEDGHFCAIFADGFIPGEDITVIVTCVGTNVLTPIVKTKPVTVNSLFNAVLNPSAEKDEKAINITVSSIRHIENLDAEISAFDTSDWIDVSQVASSQADYMAGISQEASSKNNLDSESAEDIDYQLFTEAVKTVFTNKSKVKQLDDFTIYKADNSVASKDSYYSISNPQIRSYNGNDFAINNLTIKAQEHAGLFAKLASVEQSVATNQGLMISHVNLISPRIMGEATAGCLVGLANDSLVIKHCAIELADPAINGSGEDLSETKANVLVQSTANHSIAGGLVGLVKNNVTIENSYVEGETFKITAKGSNPSVGGMIGEVRASGGSLVLKDCYSTALIEIEASKKSTKANAGGMIGSIQQVANAQIEKSYVAGRTQNGGEYNPDSCNVTAKVLSGQANLAGFIGEINQHNTAVSIKDCYTTASVSGNATKNMAIGGFIGKTGNLAITDSYATGLVASNNQANKVGSFIGEVLGDISAFDSNNYILSGINLSSIPIVGNANDENQYNEIAEKASSDKIRGGKDKEKCEDAHPYDKGLLDSDENQKLKDTGTFPLRVVTGDSHYGDWPIADAKFESNLVYYEEFWNQDQEHKDYYFEGYFNEDDLTDKQSASYIWDGSQYQLRVNDGKEAPVSFIREHQQLVLDSGYALFINHNLDDKDLTVSFAGELASLTGGDTGENTLENKLTVMNEAEILKTAIVKAMASDNNDDYHMYYCDGMQKNYEIAHGAKAWFDGIFEQADPNPLEITLFSKDKFIAKYAYLPYLARTVKSAENKEDLIEFGNHFEVRSLNQYEAIHAISHKDKGVMSKEDIMIHQTLDIDFTLRQYHYTESSLLKLLAASLNGAMIDCSNSSATIQQSLDKDKRYWIKGLDYQTFVGEIVTKHNQGGILRNLNFDYSYQTNEENEKKVATNRRIVTNNSGGVVDSIDIICHSDTVNLNRQVHLYNAIVNTNSGIVSNCRASNFTLKDLQEIDYLGGLVGQTSGHGLKNCHVTDISMDNIRGFTYLGGLVGFSNANVEECSVKAEANSELMNFSNIIFTKNIFTKNGGAVGGLIGSSNANVTKCSVEAIKVNRVDASIPGILCDTAGLLGQATGGQIKDCFVDKINFTEIKSVTHAAGLIGQTNRQWIKIMNCSVENMQADIVNSFAGLIHTNLAEIENCYLKDSSIISEDSVAGFVYQNSGTISQSKVSDCPIIGRKNRENAGFVFTNAVNANISNCQVSDIPQLLGCGFAYNNQGTISKSTVQKSIINANSRVGRIIQTDSPFHSSVVMDFLADDVINSFNSNTKLTSMMTKQNMTKLKRNKKQSVAGFVYQNSGTISQSEVSDCPTIGQETSENAGFVFNNLTRGSIIDCDVRKIDSLIFLYRTQRLDSYGINGCGFAYTNQGTITNPSVSQSTIKSAGLVWENSENGIVKRINSTSPSISDCQINGDGFGYLNEGEISNIEIKRSDIADTGFVYENSGVISKSTVKSIPMIGKKDCKKAGFVFYNREKATISECLVKDSQQIYGAGFNDSNSGKIEDCSVENIGLASYNQRDKKMDFQGINGSGFAHTNEGTIKNPFISNSYIKDAGLVYTNLGRLEYSPNQASKEDELHSPVILHCTIDGAGVVEENKKDAVIANIDIVNSQIASTGFVGTNNGIISACQLYSNKAQYKDYLLNYLAAENSDKADLLEKLTNIDNEELQITWKDLAIDNEHSTTMVYQPGNIVEAYLLQFGLCKKDDDDERLVSEINQDEIIDLIGKSGRPYTLLTIGKKSDGTSAKDVVGFAKYNTNKIEKSSVTANFTAENKGLLTNKKANLAGFVMENSGEINLSYVNLRTDIKDQVQSFSGFVNRQIGNEASIQQSFAIGSCHLLGTNTAGFINTDDAGEGKLKYNYCAINNEHINNRGYVTFTQNEPAKDFENCFSVEGIAVDNQEGYRLEHGIKYGSQRQIVKAMSELSNFRKCDNVQPYSEYLTNDYPYGYFKIKQDDKLPILFGDYYVENSDLVGKNVYVESVVVTKADIEATPKGVYDMYLRHMTVWYYDEIAKEFVKKELPNIGYYAKDKSEPRRIHRLIQIDLKTIGDKYGCTMRSIARECIRPYLTGKCQFSDTLLNDRIDLWYTYTSPFCWKIYNEGVSVFSQENYLQVFPDDSKMIMLNEENIYDASLNMLESKVELLKSLAKDDQTYPTLLAEVTSLLVELAAIEDDQITSKLTQYRQEVEKLGKAYQQEGILVEENEETIDVEDVEISNELSDTQESSATKESSEPQKSDESAESSDPKESSDQKELVDPKESSEGQEDSAANHSGVQSDSEQIKDEN